VISIHTSAPSPYSRLSTSAFRRSIFIFLLNETSTHNRKMLFSVWIRT
jgi:hypothetical protein